MVRQHLQGERILENRGDFSSPSRHPTWPPPAPTSSWPWSLGSRSDRRASRRKRRQTVSVQCCGETKGTWKEQLGREPGWLLSHPAPRGRPPARHPARGHPRLRPHLGTAASETRRETRGKSHSEKDPLLFDTGLAVRKFPSFWFCGAK